MVKGFKFSVKLGFLLVSSVNSLELNCFSITRVRLNSL